MGFFTRTASGINRRLEKDTERINRMQRRSREEITALGTGEPGSILHTLSITLNPSNWPNLTKHGSLLKYYGASLRANEAARRLVTKLAQLPPEATEDKQHLSDELERALMTELVDEREELRADEEIIGADKKLLALLQDAAAKVKRDMSKAKGLRGKLRRATSSTLDALRTLKKK